MSWAELTGEDVVLFDLDCEIAVETFNFNYGFNFTSLEVSELIGGFGSLCGDQESIDALIIEHLNNLDCEELASNLDAVIVSSSLRNSCPKTACILSEMLNGSFGTSFVCDLLSGFDGTVGNNNGVGFHLHVRAEDFSTEDNLNNAASAVTYPIELTSNDKRIVMLINTLHCETTSAVDIFETLQHELIHADLNRRLIEDYNWDATELTEAEVFHQLVINEFGGQAGENQHYLMLEQYLDDMVNSMIEMNNGVGTYADFAGAVLNGFPLEIINYCGITYEEVVQKHGAFQAFINTPGNINSILTSCGQ